MEHATLSDIVLGSIVPVAVILLLVWGIKRALDHWADRRAQRRAVEPRRFIEAELVDAATAPSSPVKCRICGTTRPGAGWMRESTIGVQGGVRGWWRRLLGLPPLYVREVATWTEPDLHSECSHARDMRIDQRIRETNLAIVTIGSQMALEHQRFLAGLDDELRESVTLAGRARRIGTTNVRALSS